MARETQGSPASEKKLEQYGVWVKVKPREVLETAAEEDSLELSDLEAPRPAPRQKTATAHSTLTADEEKLLDDLDMQMGPQDATSEVLVPEEEPLLEEADLPDIEKAVGSSPAPDSMDLVAEELPELDEAPVEPRPAARPAARKAAPVETEVEVTLSDEVVAEDHFDDLAALESELATTASATREAAGSSASSAQILARIEEELKSIRTDLTQLRTELSGLRSKAGTEPAAESAGRAESPSGFFDEEEDETIALTGDELDNILNSADITEEAAEASTETSSTEMEMVDLESLEAPAAGLPPDDILSYDTPVLEEDALPPVDEITEQASAAPDANDTLVLTDDALLPGDDAGAEPVEELPSELVLEDLGAVGSKATGEPADSMDDLAEMDLESIPELDAEEVLVPAPTPAVETTTLDELGDETIDLETLDLGEEPKVIDAVAEQVDDLETVEDAEAVLDEEPAPAASSGPIPEIPTDDVDLEALAAEAEELDDSPIAAVATEDLEIGELESVPDEQETPPSAAEEIEIPFETETPTPSPEVDAELEQILDAEEVGDEETTPAQSPAATAAGAKQADGIPDNLKEEIRTVLKYMDNLLEALPDEKIQEFAKSDYFVMYKKLFEDLGLGE